MKKQIFGFALISVMLIAPSAHANVTLLDKDDWKVQMYGFVETDVVEDSTRGFNEVLGNNPVPRDGNLAGANHRMQFSARNSRLGFVLNAPEMDGWKTKGVFELDFLGYEPSVSPGTATGTVKQSESAFYSNPTLRIRHAYSTVSNDSWQLLAGQTWTLFGWQPIYFPTTYSVSPIAGENYQRTLQLQAMKTFDLGSDNRLQAAVSIERPSQEDSNVPNATVGVNYSLDSYRSGFASAYGDVKTVPLSVGLSGSFKQFKTSSMGIYDQKSYSSSALAVNALIPILASPDGKDTGNSLTLTAEYANGTGIADELSGWTGGFKQFPTTGANNIGDSTNLDAGQGAFDAGGEFHLLKLQTFNTALQYQLPTGLGLAVNVGYAQTSLINKDDVVTTSANWDKTSVGFANLVYDLSKAVRVAAEYDQVTTHYMDQKSFLNERYQLTALFRF